MCRADESGTASRCLLLFMDDLMDYMFKIQDGAQKTPVYSGGKTSRINCRGDLENTEKLFDLHYSYRSVNLISHTA